MTQLDICFCLLSHAAGYTFHMADYQLIECHAKLPQPAVRFDREQFIYKEENAIFDNIGNLSGRFLLFLPSEFSAIDIHPFQVSSTRVNMYIIPLYAMLLTSDFMYEKYRKWKIKRKRLYL